MWVLRIQPLALYMGTRSVSSSCADSFWFKNLYYMYVIFPFIVNEEAELFTGLTRNYRADKWADWGIQKTASLWIHSLLCALCILCWENTWVVLKARGSSKFSEHTSVRWAATEQGNQQTCATAEWTVGPAVSLWLLCQHTSCSVCLT